MENTASTLGGESVKTKSAGRLKGRRKIGWVSKRKRLSHKKSHRKPKILPDDSVDPLTMSTQEMCPEEITTDQIKTEDIETSPPATPSTLSNTESIPDQFNIEDPPIKIEDFDVENRNYEDGCTEESSNRDTDLITGDLPGTNADTESRSILYSALTTNAANQSCQNSGNELDTDINSRTHVWESSATQLPDNSSPGSLLLPSGQSFKVKQIIIIKPPNPANSKPAPEEVRDPLEINPLEVVNPLEVRDPLQLSKEATSISDLLMSVKQRLDFMLFPRWHALIHLDAIHAIFISPQINISIQRSLVFSTNGDVELYVHRQRVDVKPFLGVASQPVPLTIATVYDFVDRIRKIVINVREMQICRGVNAEKYKPGWKTCTQGKIDDNPYDEYSYKETFRSLQCLWLVRRVAFRCAECAKLYRPLARKASAATRPFHPNTANIYLTEEQKLQILEDQGKRMCCTETGE